MAVYITMTVLVLGLAALIKVNSLTPAGALPIRRGMTRQDMINIIVLLMIFSVLFWVSALRLNVGNDYAKYVENLLQPVQKQSLSQAIMETLAVIAYRQPVTKAEVEQIRGVKCDYSIQALAAKGLIEEAGRKEALGRPILYATTDSFLRHFCISSLDELPEIDFSKLAKPEEEKPAVEEGEFDIGTPVSGQSAGSVRSGNDASPSSEPSAGAETAGNISVKEASEE